MVSWYPHFTFVFSTYIKIRQFKVRTNGDKDNPGIGSPFVAATCLEYLLDIHLFICIQLSSCLLLIGRKGGYGGPSFLNLKS